jgi:S1/P1 Nuclease
MRVGVNCLFLPDRHVRINFGCDYACVPEPQYWANESLALTIEYVYPLPDSHEIGEEYVKRALPILHRRLVEAGVRLAWLLNDALK